MDKTTDTTVPIVQMARQYNNFRRVIMTGETLRAV